MNDEINVHASSYPCPECDGQMRLEFTRAEAGGDVTSEVHECRDCGESFELREGELVRVTDELQE